METPVAQRVTKSRAKKKIVAQVERAGGTVLDVPDVIAKHNNGTLYRWDFGAGWTKLS